MVGNSMGMDNSEVRADAREDRKIRFLKFPFHYGKI